MTPKNKMTSTINEIINNKKYNNEKQLLLSLYENYENNLKLISKIRGCILVIVKLFKCEKKYINSLTLLNDAISFIDERETLLFIRNNNLSIDSSVNNVNKYLKIKKKQNVMLEKIIERTRDIVIDNFGTSKDINVLSKKLNKIIYSMEKIDDNIFQLNI
jgi:hypothetical protein